MNATSSIVIAICMIGNCGESFATSKPATTPAPNKIPRMTQLNMFASQYGRIPALFGY
jgi:hypothetical protein